VTFGLTIFDILHDPNSTFGIFAHDKKTSKEILRQIKTEFESNVILKATFKNILYADPKTQSPRWSLDDGIVVKRKGNSREATVEAHSIHSLPTGKHFKYFIGDDLVTEESVSTPEQIASTERQFGLATELTTRDPVHRMVGTFYAHNDLYNWMIDRRLYHSRKVPATDDGTANGKPIFWTQEEFNAKYKSKSVYIANCQLLLNPKMENAAGFRPEWWKTWPNNNLDNLNLYVIVDPAGTKNKSSDSTAMWLIGYGSDDNIYVVDLIIDKLSLTEKADILFDWHREYKIKGTYYEKVGLQTDREHIEYRQDQENFRFPITDVSPEGKKKNSRIDALEPWFKEGRIFMPPSCYHINYTGEKVDMVKMFKNNEYLPYPVLTHDDGLDALSYINKIDFVKPGVLKKRRRRRKNNVVPFKATGTTGAIAGGY